MSEARQSARRARMPLRRPMAFIEMLMGAAAAVGAVQLITGSPTPSDRLLPSGLHSWVLPGLWLFASVCLPAAVATWFLLRGESQAPAAVLVANAGLGIELVVQMPFIGFSWLQCACGAVGVAACLLAVAARHRGWTRSRAGATSQLGT